MTVYMTGQLSPLSFYSDAPLRVPVSLNQSDQAHPPCSANKRTPRPPAPSIQEGPGRFCFFLLFVNKLSSSPMATTILPPATSPQDSFSIGSEDFTKNSTTLLVVDSHGVSLDFVSRLVVPDQSLQQFVPPVENVSDLTQFVSHINGEI